MFIQIWHWKTAPWFLILRRLIGCTDESTNQKSPNFKRKITLNSKNFYLVYQYYEYMYMYSNHFFFKIHRNYSHNLLKIISFIFQISIILYHWAIQYNLIETHTSKCIQQFEFYTHLIWTHAATWSSQVKGRRQDHFPFSRPHTPTIRPASTCQDP